MKPKTVTLGSICGLVNGKAFKPSDWSTSGVPIVRIQNLNGLGKPFNYFCGSLSNQVRVKGGDLLLAWSGTPGTSFGAHIWQGEAAILNQHIFRCDIDRSTITAEWAKFVINAQLDQLVDLAHGGVGLKHVTRGVVEDLEIPLPTLAEQERVAKVLDQAEALRAKRRAALAQLDTLTQAIFFDLFGDPATNPKEMPKSALGDLLKLRSGEFLPATVMSPTGTHPVIGGNGINGHHDKYMFDVPQIIIGRVGVYCGCVHVSPPKSWVTDNALYVSEQRADIEFDYLVHALIHANLNQYASQSGQPLVSGSRIYPVEILVPPLRLQRDFASRIGALKKLRASHVGSEVKLDDLFAVIQHRAFRGEL